MKNAVERIRHSVREEAEAEAAHILHEAREELDRSLAEARGEEEQMARVRLEEQRARLVQEGMREISRAQRGLRLALLEARNRVIDEIFSRVRQEALRLPQEKWRAVLGRWLGEIDAREGGEIIPAARDARLLEGLVREANAERGPACRLSFSPERAPFESGFILRTQRYEVMKSLDGWLEDRKKEMAPELEKDLFGETGNAHAD